MQSNLFQVDAFTSQPFAGNPAAVYLLEGPRDDAWMQNVAREMNLSETAFLTRKRESIGLRWFTPAVEVALCGHATLASAHVLWEQEYLLPDEEARFETLSGTLTARRDGDWIEMNFPAKRAQKAEPAEGLLTALGLTSVIYTGRNEFDYLLEVESEQAVADVHPDFERLAQVDARGVIVTSRAHGGEYDFVSRFFGPRVGVNEDPVTGSAHCCLGPYWSEKLHRDELVGYQASARGGVVRTRTAGDRVYLGGQAITVVRGRLL
jgi:PhzF family phenazine biosynthesis protein